MSPGIVAVTGATGFIGRHLGALLASRGWRLRFLVRAMSDLSDLPRGVELVLGDLDDENALRRLVADATAVVHLAGAIKARRPEDFRRINTLGTARLVDRCWPSPSLRCFILLSSLAARQPKLSPYAASKRAAEELLTERNGNLPWIALRAPVVYGPADAETLAIFRMSKNWVFPIAAGGRGRVSLIHVHDLARAIADTIERPPEPGLYEIDDGAPHGYTQGEIAGLAGALCGRRPRLVSIPKAAMMAVAGLAQIIAGLAGRPAILSIGKVNEIWHPDWVARDRRLATHLGFESRYDIHRGFRDTIRWYRDHSQL